MQPINITAHGAQYELIRFNAPLPRPSAPSVDLLPQDKREREVKHAELCQQQRDAKIELQKENAHGIVDTLTTTCEEAMNALDKTITAAINTASDAFNTQNEDHAYGRLRQAFPEFVTERLVGDYRCKLCTRNGVLPGFLQVTQSHIVFIPEDGTAFAFSACAILCIQTIKQAECPSVPPKYQCVCIAPLNEADGLQLFVASGQLLIFKEFLSLRSLTTSIVSEAFTVIDRVWRNSTTVPDPNWQFTEPEKFVQPDITVYPIKSKNTSDLLNATSSRVPILNEQCQSNALETHS